MKKSLLITLSVLLILIIAFVISFGGKNKPEAINNIMQKFSSSEENQERNPIIETTNPTNNPTAHNQDSAGAGDGRGSTGAPSPDTSEEECRKEQISYSLLSTTSNQVCDTFEDKTCIEKTITCSTNVLNLDQEIEGTFVMDFKYFELGNKGNIIQTLSNSETIPPRERVSISTEITITGANANKEITCSSLSNSTPTKQVC
ncbi:MAG: hypothetical protein ABIG28_02420 [archaeon]